MHLDDTKRYKTVNRLCTPTDHIFNNFMYYGARLRADRPPIHRKVHERVFLH
jgi:hypothetical protein